LQDERTSGARRILRFIPPNGETVWRYTPRITTPHLQFVQQQIAVRFREMKNLQKTCNSSARLRYNHGSPAMLNSHARY
jgi:hypothetical protein